MNGRSSAMEKERKVKMDPITNPNKTYKLLNDKNTSEQKQERRIMIG